MSRPYDVLVIGGGTSGMSAAIAVARKGVDVILLEAGDHIGGQLLTAENGNYYVTNEKVGPEYYYDADLAIIDSVLGNLTGAVLQTRLEEIGLALKSDEGRICPASEQAVDVRDALRLQLNSRFVRVETYQKPRGYPRIRSRWRSAPWAHPAGWRRGKSRWARTP